MFFKDGREEQTPCQGAQVMELLVHRKRIDMMKMPPLTKESGLWKKYKEELGNCVCNQCSFRTEGCDFRSEEPSDDMEPCGGFILLAHLKKNNLINLSDLELLM